MIINELFDNHTVINICKISLGSRDVEDKFIWLRNKNSVLYVKSFYLSDQEKRFKRDSETFWRKIWGLKIQDCIIL